MNEIIFLAGFAVLLFVILKSRDISPPGLSQILEEIKIIKRKLEQEASTKSLYRCHLIIPIYLEDEHVGEFNRTIRTTRPPQIGSYISGTMFLDAQGKKFEPNSFDDEKLLEEGVEESDGWQFGPITEVIDYYQDNLYHCRVKDHHVGGEGSSDENLESWKRYLVKKGWKYDESLGSIISAISGQQD